MRFFPPQGLAQVLVALGCALMPGDGFAPQASWPTYSTGEATLPASAVAAYDASRVLGACVLNGSSQYGVTSDLGTDSGEIAAGTTLPAELGNGTARVLFARFDVAAGTGTRAVAAFGDSGDDTQYAYLNVTAPEGVNFYITDGAVANSATVLSSPQSGRVSVAAKITETGTLRIAVLGPSATEVTWVTDDAETPTLTGLDRFTIGALSRSSVIQHFDSWIAEVGIGVAESSVTDAAMEAFCKGASLADVGAASGWDLQESFAATRGTVDLTNTGSATFTGTDVVVVRDHTADATAYPDHAQSDVVGGAQFSGSNYLSSSLADPGVDFYWSAFVKVPDATPAANVTFLGMDDGSAVNRRRIYVNTSNELRIEDRAADSPTTAQITTGLTANVFQLVVGKFTADGTSRTLWVAPVGGAFRTATGSTTKLPTGITTAQVGGTAGANELPESGTVVAYPRITTAAQVTAAGGETKWLRSLLRNWKQNQAASEHAWTLNGAAGLSDTGSGTAADLSWSASAAYSTAQVVSSHYHALAVGGVTYNASTGEIVGDGSTGYLRLANGMPLYDEDFALVARVRSTLVTGSAFVFEADDGAGTQTLNLLRSTAQSVGGWDGRTPASGSGWVAGELVTAQLWKNSSAVGCAAGDNEGTASLLTASPVTTRATFLAGADATTFLGGSLARTTILADPDERTEARTWAEGAAA